ETLRPALQRERGSFSNWSTEARPFARSTVVGSEVGAKLKGLERFSKIDQKKKGLYAPLLPLAGAIPLVRRNLSHRPEYFSELHHKTQAHA
ncbi:MAG TPA: hypothetical protein VFN10_23735, partial [Thermoanaerobaculia bacterium]|nr:hypothetical protein [Thermoanaerobaculia bacterium]